MVVQRVAVALVVSFLIMYASWCWRYTHYSGFDQFGPKAQRPRVEKPHYPVQQVLFDRNRTDVDVFSVPGFVHPSEWLPTPSRNYSQFTIPMPGNRRLPKVYVYDIPPQFGLNNVKKTSVADAYGEVVANKNVPGMRNTDQFGLAHVVTYRILHSQIHTENPHEADLFMFPISVGNDDPKMYYKQQCNIRHDLANFRSWLRFLNESTVQRHFFVNGFHWPTSRWACLRLDDHYAKDPPSVEAHSLLVQIPWVNIEVRWEAWQGKAFSMLRSGAHYREYLCGATGPQWRVRYTVENADCHGAIINMPRPPCVHWTQSLWAAATPPPWMQHGQSRNVLLSYIGRTAQVGKPGFKRRLPIKKLCDKYPTSRIVCSEYAGPEATYNLKSRSIFCLDPVGDSPGRRSTVDSYAVGCIPVLIGVVQAFLYPEQWAGWHDSAFLVVDAELFRKGLVDLVKLLEAVPLESIHFMQQQIAKFAPRMLYNEDDLPELEDGVDYLVRGLHARAQTGLEHSGG